MQGALLAACLTKSLPVSVLPDLGVFIVLDVLFGSGRHRDGWKIPPGHLGVPLPWNSQQLIQGLLFSGFLIYQDPPPLSFSRLFP